MTFKIPQFWVTAVTLCHQMKTCSASAPLPLCHFKKKGEDLWSFSSCRVLSCLKCDLLDSLWRGVCVWKTAADLPSVDRVRLISGPRSAGRAPLYWCELKLQTDTLSNCCLSEILISAIWPLTSERSVSCQPEEHNPQSSTDKSLLWPLLFYLNWLDVITCDQSHAGNRLRV